MVKEFHSESATKPVCIAVLSTLLACGVCLAVYHKIYVEPKLAAASNDALSKCVEADSPARAASESRRPRQRKPVIAHTAAMLRALNESRDAMHDSTKTPETAEEDTSTDEEDVFLPPEEEILAMRQAKMASLAEQLANEPLDVDWANETEDAATEAIGALAADLRLEEVTCRSTFCRAQLNHHDPSTRQDDLEQLMTRHTLMHQMVSFSPPDDETRTVMYFAREGHTLSVLTPQGRPGEASGPRPGSAETEK